MYMNTIKCLTDLPADDCNFKSTLSSATANQIRLALEVMRGRDGKDKSRIAAFVKGCRKESHELGGQAVKET